MLILVFVAVMLFGDFYNVQRNLKIYFNKFCNKFRKKGS